MSVNRADLDTSSMIGPVPAALRADAGDLLVPPQPAAAIGQVNHTRRQASRSWPAWAQSLVPWTRRICWPRWIRLSQYAQGPSYRAVTVPGRVTARALAGASVPMQWSHR
jgi:hypothetical protein